MENSELDELNSLRNEIDNTDRHLIEYFEKRAEISKKIGLLKQKSGQAIFDPEREQKIIKQRSSWLKDSTLAYESEAFIRAVIASSRRLQNPQNLDLNADIIPMNSPDLKKAVAYLGTPGSYGEKAALFSTNGDEKRLLSQSFLEGVFKAVWGDDCYGIVPVENSINTEVLELLKQYDCKIIRQIKKNFITQFAVISRKQEVFPTADMVCITFGLPNKSGALCNALTYFQKYNLNLLKIESLSLIGEQLTYSFYIEFEGNFHDENTLAVLSALKNEAFDLVILGFYDTEDANE